MADELVRYWVAIKALMGHIDGLLLQTTLFASKSALYATWTLLLIFFALVTTVHVLRGSAQRGKSYRSYRRH